MAFKLTYTDGQEAEYDDDTAWEVDDGVLKMGRKEGDWTVLVSPSHWAVVEVGSVVARAADGDDSGDDSKKDSKKDSDDESTEDSDSDKADKKNEDDKQDD